MADPHSDEPRAATPVSAETSAAIKGIKTSSPEKASLLSIALKTIAKTIAASIMNEKLSAVSATFAAADAVSTTLKIPSIKPPTFDDATKKIGSILGGVKNKDTAKLQESIDAADQSPDPNALDDFEKQMSQQALARSQQRQAELSSSLSVVNGFRNEIDA